MYSSTSLLLQKKWTFRLSNSPQEKIFELENECLELYLERWQKLVKTLETRGDIVTVKGWIKVGGRLWKFSDNRYFTILAVEDSTS